MSRKLSRREAIALSAAAPLAYSISSLFAGSSAAAASGRLFAPDAAPGARRRALLIGVAEYERPGTTRWCNLTTGPDVFTMRAILKGRFGFTNEEIFCLTTPADTTHDKIVGAIQTFLVEWAKPGDAIYFHYSGHGAGRYTADGTPCSTLVPHDWREPDPNLPTGDGAAENHVTQNELLRLFGAVKQNMTPTGKTDPLGTLFLTFDSCHSGTIVRGEVKVRGEKPSLVPPPPPNAKPIVRGTGDTLLPPPPAAPRRRMRGEAAPDALGTGFTALFACRYDQSAYEINGVKRFTGVSSARGEQEAVGNMGRFSYFLAQALDKSTSDTTYQDVHDMVHGQISASGYNSQTPDLRGDTDHRLFGGAGPKRVAYVAAEWQPDAEDSKTNQLLLRAGQLVGVTEGSTYALFKIGDDPQKGAVPAATATVQSVNTASAVLVPDKAGLNQNVPYRAVETRHVYGSDPLLVSVADIRSHPQGPAIIAKLSELAKKDVGLLTLTDDTPKSFLAVTRSNTFATTLAKTRDENENDFSKPGFVIERVKEGTALTVIPDSGDAESADAVANAVSEALKNAARLRILLSLTNNDAPSNAKPAAGSNAGGVGSGGDGVHVAMRLLPCTKVPKVSKKGEKYMGFGGLKTSAANARGEYQGNESFVIEVENTGTVKAYLNILDLSPDGTINPIYPPEKSQLQVFDPGIDPGTKRVLSVNGDTFVITMSKPYGSETIKLIATDQNVDFSPLLSPARTRGGGTPTEAQAKGESAPLGRLFRTLSQGKRGATTDMPPNDNQWCTGAVVLKVTPPPQKAN